MTRCRWFLLSRKHQPFRLYFLCIFFHYCLSDAMVSFRRSCAQMLALEFTVEIGFKFHQPLKLEGCRKEKLPLPAKLYWYKLRLVSLCNFKAPINMLSCRKALKTQQKCRYRQMRKTSRLFNGTACASTLTPAISFLNGVLFAKVSVLVQSSIPITNILSRRSCLLLQLHCNRRMQL